MRDVSEETIRQASKGNIEYFEEIYHAYSGFVYNTAYRVVNRWDEAEEVTQDVFITIYRKLKSFRYKSSFRTWVYRIAVNRAINHAKKRSRERERTVTYDESMGLSTPMNPTHESRDREKILSNLLAALNPDQRACLVLRDLEGLRYEEIADVLKVNINTVRSRLKRGREKLLVISREVAQNEM